MEVGANVTLPRILTAKPSTRPLKPVLNRNFIFNELTNKALLSGLRTKKVDPSPEDVQLNDKELRILKLMCEEKTTKEIAESWISAPARWKLSAISLKPKPGPKAWPV